MLPSPDLTPESGRLVYVNGVFVPESEAHLSVFDRGFLYGDALFETLRFCRGKPWLWDAHANRLQRGAQLLRLPLPHSTAELRSILHRLLDLNRLPDAFVRIHLSRGCGPRGYSPRGAGPPTLVIVAFPAPSLGSEPPLTWRVRTSRYRLPANDLLAPTKTTNRLLHILARAEADDAGADEALLLDSLGRVAELSAANIFWFKGNACFTPALSTGALDGVTRSFVQSLLEQRGWICREVTADPPDLQHADGTFATLSTLGIVPLVSLDGTPLGASPRLREIQSAYHEALCRLLSD